MATISLTLDGRAVRFEPRTGTTALDALRHQLGATTPKNGCQPEGRCGCCAVLWDGRPSLLCLRPATALEGATITTHAGLPEAEREILSRAFVDAAGVQCGFCTPGFAIRIKALLDRHPEPDGTTIRKALKGHLCRCTGYGPIVDAVQRAARSWPDGEPEPRPVDARLGGSHARYRGRELVLGERPYVADLVVPDMLFGALRLCDHPRARVLSIDVALAEAMAGVRVVMTAVDVWGQRHLGLLVPDWPVLVAPGETTACIGDVLAIVAADDEATARRAAAAIRVQYEVLPPLCSPDEALAEGAPRVHEERPNLAGTTAVKRGDVDPALAASAHVLSERFTTQRVEHAYLEPECCLAVPQPDKSLRLHTQGQGVHDDRRQVAAALGLDLDRVHVVLEPNGGGFGGKEDLSCQAHAALLAVRTGRPVRLELTRAQSVLLSPKRHPLVMDYTVGCDAHGRLTAVRARIVGDTGGHLSVGTKVLERAAGHSCGPYRVPAVDVEARTVYTNNPPSGAFRGFGVNQVAFAMEGMLDRLAERVGIDGYDIRERNVLDPGDRFATGQRMDAGTGIRRTLEALKDVYKSAPRAGIACGLKNTGMGNGIADVGRTLIEVDRPDHLTVYTGFTEMGQGLLTVLQQVVCHETGLEPHQVDVVVSTERPVECGMTTASRATMLAGEATRRAATSLREAMTEAPLADLQGRSFPGEFVCDFTSAPGQGGDDAVTHVAFGFATQVVLLDEAGRLERVVAAHDVGRVMNRASCIGQVEGAIVMGLGFALTEDLPCEGGVPVSTRLDDMALLRAPDVPDIEVRLIEVPEPHTAYGVKGVGEIGLVPTAPAVAEALYRFDGVRRTRLPMRDSPAAKPILPRRLRS